MRLLLKLVAVVIALTLAGGPLMAAVPCRSAVSSSDHCTQCCHMPGASMAAMHMSPLARAASLPDAPCCSLSCAKAEDQATQREASQSLGFTSLAAPLHASIPTRPTAASHARWPELQRDQATCAQSRLCTFRI